MVNKIYRLSIIVPCYNEGEKIINAYKKLVQAISKQFPKDFVEIIFVNDGSNDNTKKILKTNLLDLHKKNKKGTYYPTLNYINSYPNHGKGYAVKQGFLKAKGKTVLYCDTDMSTDLKDLITAVNLVEKGNTIAFGSRTLPNSDLPEEKKNGRKLMSIVSQKLSSLVFGWEQMDTQCGFKALEKNFAKKVACVQVVNRFAFDLEYLYAAKLGKFEIVSFPVRWIDDKDSRVHPIKDSIKFIKDIVVIKNNKKNLKKVLEI